MLAASTLQRAIGSSAASALRSRCLLPHLARGTGATTGHAAARSASAWVPRSQRPAGSKGPSMQVEEALYLAKEAGYFTARERQLQIVRSPPFSPRDRPFLIENFFEVADYEKAEPAKAKLDPFVASRQPH